MIKLLVVFGIIGGVVVVLDQHHSQDRGNNILQKKVINQEVYTDHGNETLSDFYDDFEDGVKISDNKWKSKQLQRGSIKEMINPLQSNDTVLVLKAGEKKGSQVGKAGLIKKKLILIDLECAACGIDTNPGIRLYLRDGTLRIDRSKIGIKQSMNQEIPLIIENDTWYNIRMEITLGEDEQGKNVVYVNDTKVIDISGTNILTQKVVDEYGIKLQKTGIDRFQIGLTANSNTRSQKLYLNNVYLKR